MFANILNTYDFDLICVTEIWLTQDFPSSTLFLDNYFIYRNDGKISEDQKSKHGGVLIAVKMNIPHQYIELGIKNSDFIGIKILTLRGSDILICNIYNSTYPSPSQWKLNDMQQLIDLVHGSAVENHCYEEIITGDLHFSQTNWPSMSSKIDYKKDLLGKLIYLNFINFSNDQLDVVICNNPDLLIKNDYQEK